MSQRDLSPETLPKSRLDEFLEQRYPVLTTIGVPFGKFSGFSRPYVRIRTSVGTEVYSTGVGLSSQYRDDYLSEEDNMICWSSEPKDDCQEFEGFVEAITTFRENGRAILHLLHHVTDIELSSAILLDDIDELAIYPDNAARVKAMHQNAEVDLNSYFYNRAKGYAISFSEAELGTIIETHWPEPEVVYTRTTE